MKIETRARFELRAEGGGLYGTAINYGEITTIGRTRERFLPGVFGDLSEADIILNFQHNRDRPIARTGSGLTLLDSSERLEVEVNLPDTMDGRDALTLVKTGIIRGLSVEFATLVESMFDGIRELSRAKLLGLGLVDRAAYSGSVVEARGAHLAAVLSDAIGDRDRDQTIVDMARAAGIDESTVNQILRGEIDHPPRQRLESFARVLGVPVSLLFDAVLRDGASPPDQYRRRVWL